MQKVSKYKIVLKKICIIIYAIFFILNNYENVFAINYAKNFLEYKLDHVRFDMPYEIIENEDKTKTYVLYNFDGDLYEDKENINEPFDTIKLKIATSSILRENFYLEYNDEQLATISEIENNNEDILNDLLLFENNIATESNIKDKLLIDNINYYKDNSDISIYDIKNLTVDKYYPVILRKKSILKIPKEIIQNMRKLDILIIFNVARNDMKIEDMWKFRYIEDVYINNNGNKKIETIDDKRTTCLELKYLNKFTNVKMMRFEYHQANDRSGYAYVDIDHILDFDESNDIYEKFDKDVVDEYITNMDYKFISDEWMVSYDNFDVDFYLRKYVTYKINVYKNVFEKSYLDIGDNVKTLKFDENGYVILIK